MEAFHSKFGQQARDRLLSLSHYKAIYCDWRARLAIDHPGLAGAPHH